MNSRKHVDYTHFSLYMTSKSPASSSRAPCFQSIGSRKTVATVGEGVVGSAAHQHRSWLGQCALLSSKMDTIALLLKSIGSESASGLPSAAKTCVRRLPPATTGNNEIQLSVVLGKRHHRRGQEWSESSPAYSGKVSIWRGEYH